MSEYQGVQEIVNDIVNDTPPSKNPKEITLEGLALLVHTQRLNHLENKITTEFTELKKRQDQVSFLHKLMKMINAATVDGQFDCSNNQEIKDFLATAHEYGVEITEGKYNYNREERDRLIDNIRMTADDYNTLNDMQLQSITRLTTERYESYHLARSIMKPLHEDKVNKARSLGGK